MKITAQQIMNRGIDPAILLNDTQLTCVEKIRDKAIEAYKQKHLNETDVETNAKEAGDIAAAEEAARIINEDQGKDETQTKQDKGLDRKNLLIIGLIGIAVIIVSVSMFLLIFSWSSNTPRSIAQKNQITVSVPGTYTFQVDLPAMQNVEASANFTPSQTTLGSTTGQPINNNAPAPQEQINQPAPEPQLNF
jgi:hypothetical protein